MIILSDIPRKHAKRIPDRECLVFEDTRLTWRQLDERIDRLSNALCDLGIRPGEHIAILAQNTHRYVELYYALSRVGMVAVPLNWRLSTEELEFVLDHSEAVALFVDEMHVDVARSLMRNVPRVRSLISLDAPVAGIADYETLIAKASGEAHEGPRDENAMFLLMYTGGTTGKPKGVMISNRNLLTATLGCLLSMKIEPQDSTLMILPLFHIALWPVLAHHYAGCKAVINRRFDLEFVLQTVQNERVTHINTVPTIVTFLLNHPELSSYDLSSLRGLTYAGAPMALTLLLDLKRRFPNLALGQGYGLTEASPTVSMLDDVEHNQTDTEKGLLRLTSAGRESQVTEVRIVDEDDIPLPSGEVGEIVVRGANIMLGYWRDPHLTENVLRNGWLHTGDMGYQDDEGYIFLIDRKNDMIISGGENVYPREVEEVLYKHPAVFLCAVVGVPDAVWGEAVKAVVVLKADQTATADELIEHCGRHLAGYKKPKSVDLVDSIPTSAIGKVLRRQVREPYWRDQLRRI